MPTRADIEAATPKCPRVVVGRRGAQLSERCALKLTPLGRSGAWSCAEHGVIEAIEIVPLRVVGVEREAL
jgi:hypothetical protein